MALGDWTDERVARLKELWDTGISASQIGKQMGGLSRAAVIGKAHRLGLPRRSTETHRLAGRLSHESNRPEGRLRRPRAVPEDHPLKAGPSKPPTPVKMSNPVVADMRPAVLRDLPPRACRWPLPNQDIPEGWAETLLFCGAALDEDEPGPYCACHRKLAYKPARKKPEAFAHWDAPRSHERRNSVFGRGRAA